MTDDQHLMRIGEFAARTGEQAHNLRVWEERFGLLNPVRTDSGYRLYSEDDVEVVLALRSLIAQGMSVGTAAKRVLAQRGPARAESRQRSEFMARFGRASASLHVGTLHRVLEDALVGFGMVAAIDMAIVPFAAENVPSGAAAVTARFFHSVTRNWLLHIGDTTVRTASPVHIRPQPRLTTPMVAIGSAAAAAVVARTGFLPLSTPYVRYLPKGIPVVTVGHSHDGLTVSNGNELTVDMDSEEGMFARLADQLGALGDEAV